MSAYYGDMLNLGAGVPFLRSQARILMKDKYVLFLGDSVQEQVILLKFSSMISVILYVQKYSQPREHSTKTLWECFIMG